VNVAPSSWPARLADGRITPPTAIPAVVLSNLPHTYLPSVEELWKPARDAIVSLANTTGARLENGHWDWSRKTRTAASGFHRVAAVECEGVCQGLMAIQSAHRPSALSAGRMLVYVDYLEAAPWNLRVAGQSPRFLGVGTLLIGESIRLSVEEGLSGRAGLHSLPQAERFYADRCQMRRLGPDAAYYDLEYFEYPEGVAAAWLAAMREER